MPGERYYDLIAGRPVESARGWHDRIVRYDSGPRCRLLCGGHGAKRRGELQALLQKQAGLNARDSKMPRHRGEKRVCVPRPVQAPGQRAGRHGGDSRRRRRLRIEMRARECGFFESMPPAEHGLASSYQFQAGEFRRRGRCRDLPSTKRR